VSGESNSWPAKVRIIAIAESRAVICPGGPDNRIFEDHAVVVGPDKIITILSEILAGNLLVGRRAPFRSASGLATLGNDLVEARNPGADIVSSIRGHLALNAASFVVGSMVPAVGLICIEHILQPSPLHLRLPFVHHRLLKLRSAAV
jgi:hypothetical protein